MTQFEEQIVKVGNAAGFVENPADGVIECLDSGRSDPVSAEGEYPVLGVIQTLGEANEFPDAGLQGDLNSSQKGFLGAFAIGVGPDLLEAILQEVNGVEIMISFQENMEFLSPC